MDLAEIARRRLFTGHLLGAPLPSPEAAVRWFGAVQSQDVPGALWALAMRTGFPDEAELRERFDEGSILRTHVMRPTWHFVDPADIRWLLDLTAPRVQAGNAGRCRQLGLDDATLARGADVMAEAVSGGTFLTRPELGTALKDAGIDTEGQRIAYLVMHAELEQRLCSGPRRGKRFTYAAFDERVPSAPRRDRDEALADLVVRYFASHGPATLRDFAWWSGLTVKDCRTGVEAAGDQLATIEVEGRTFVMSPASPFGRLGSPVIHLLPNYDESVASFTDYEPAFDSQALGVERTDDALTRHLLMQDGRIIGGWKRDLRAHHVDITLMPLIHLGARQRTAISRAAEVYATFLGREVGALHDVRT